MTQDSTSPELRDQYLLAYILGQLVNQLFSCDLILQDQVDDRPSYPFVTFNFITIENNETSDWIEEGRIYTTDVQLDCHARDFYKANSMASKLLESLRGPIYRNYFEQADIVLRRAYGVSNRTVLEGTNYDYDVGFDAQFAIRSKLWTEDQLVFVPQPSIGIETLSVGNSNSGKQIGAKNNDKETK